MLSPASILNLVQYNIELTLSSINLDYFQFCVICVCGLEKYFRYAFLCIHFLNVFSCVYIIIKNFILSNKILE